MAKKDERGRAGEDRAEEHLRSLGWEVLDRNWRTGEGELDLVAATASALVVVEVKTRAGEAFGHPLEAIDARKRRRLWRLAVAWVAAHPAAVQGRRLRVDAVAITGPDPRTARLEHLEDVA